MAASIIPDGTSFNDDSTILATIGIAPIVRGTIVAVVPIDAPTINRVTGIRRTSKIRNGSERLIFTIAPTTVLINLFSN